MSFNQVLYVFHAKLDMGFGQGKSWNFHGICQENDGVSIGFGLISDLVSFFTKLQSKRNEKIDITFFTGSQRL